jgi:hypothetical protein
MTALSAQRATRLRLYNAVMGGAHLAQAALVLILANDFSLPVVATFMTGPPGAADPEITHLFDLRVAWGVFAFLMISAVAHWTLVAPRVFDWYRGQLERERNYARWIEYAFSSSIMVVLIAMLTGIADVAALVAIFGVNASMILFGWLMEKYESPGRPNWLSYWFGVITGAVPWLVMVIYFWGPGIDVSPPTFVYAIFISLFIFFNSFAVNMVLQYRRVGPWRDYVFGESVYVLLSLTAKSALAWQVFGSTLAG